MAARYGLYRSKLGIGAEARKGKFFIEGNAYGLNDPSYNLYGGVTITRNLDLMAGAESIQRQRLGFDCRAFAPVKFRFTQRTQRD